MADLLNNMRTFLLRHFTKKGRSPSIDSETYLYFDWRKLRERPMQNHENIHPGEKFLE
jgi:hypothetical protein